MSTAPTREEIFEKAEELVRKYSPQDLTNVVLTDEDSLERDLGLDQEGVARVTYGLARRYGYFAGNPAPPETLGEAVDFCHDLTRPSSGSASDVLDA